MKKWLLFFTTLIILFGANQTMAQCAENWDKARTDFENGHLYGIPALLGDCLENGFSKQEKIEAYRLLTITYLYIDDPYGAQNSFLSLLKLDPEYRIKPNDPIELAQLNKQFITTPIISWRARLGTNYSFIAVINPITTGNSELKTAKYMPQLGYTAVGAIDVHFNKVISLSLDLELSTNTYKYENFLYNKDSLQNALEPQSLKEVAYNASLPLCLKLTYPGVIYYPYIYGGYSPTYNIYTKSTANYTIKPQNDTENPLDPKTLDISLIRKRFSESIIVGGGLMRRLNYQYIFFDVRFRFGLTNLLKTDAQFLLDEKGYADINTYSLMFKKTDSQFRQNDLTVTVGWVLPQYKPRKKNEITFSSIIGGVFNKKDKDE